MSTIIKASDHSLDVQRVVFNLDDMTARADRHIERLRGEAAAVVAKAQTEADAIRRRAEEEGRKQGLQAVRQMVDKQLGEQLATLMPALKKVITDLDDARHAWLGHWEKSVVHLAAEIAKRIVRRELAGDPEITLALVREGP